VTAVARPGAPTGLHRILGVGFGLAVIIGSTIGIGILRTPGLVAGQLGSPAAILAAWIAGGLYTLVGAVCLTELGTMVPEASSVAWLPFCRKSSSNGGMSMRRKR